MILQYNSISNSTECYYMQKTGGQYMKPLKTSISITLDSDIVEVLRTLAEEDDRSLSQYINIVLRKHLKSINQDPADKNS